MFFKQSFKFLRRKPNVFFELIKDQSQKTLQGMKTLESFMENLDHRSAVEVGRLEKDADEARRVLIERLNRSFVTPIDREDIFDLSRAVDDILDYGYSTVDEMIILGVKPNDDIRRIATILAEASNEIHLAILQLPEQPQIILKHAARAKKLENEVEALYREALSKLFKDASSVSEILNILKMREIYRHLSNAADRVDAAANILSTIAVKTT